MTAGAHTFRYRAVRRDGSVSRGILQATSRRAAADVLARQGLFPLSFHETRARSRVRPAGGSELAVVFRSIASLTSVGVPLERAMAASEAVAKGRLAKALVAARERVREGASLGTALEAANGLFPAAVIGVIAAGEKGSRLDAALEETAKQLEREAELYSTIESALAYPMVILTAGIASIAFMATVVVPRFAALLADLGQELPRSTTLLLSVADLSGRFWWVAVLAAVGGAALFVGWMRTPRGRLQWDSGLLRTPLVGGIRHRLATARTCRAVSGMLRSGMPLLSALAAARDATGDTAVARRLDLARNRVARGEPLSTSLRRERALVAGALQFVTVGEESGELAAMVERAGDHAAREAEVTLKSLVTILEPALVVLLGGLVAVVAAALLQAVYSLSPGVAG